MKRREFLKTSGLVGGGALLAACAPSAPVLGQGPSSSTPKRGGILKWQSTSTPGIDISQNTAGANLWAMGAVYERLLSFRANSYTDSELVPGLVEKWTMSSDAKSITLNLKKGITWQNIAPVNGREFTSDDIKWNVEYYQTKAPPVKYVFDAVASVATPDKYTAVLTLKEPSVAFAVNLADKHAFMYPKEVFAQKGSFKDTAIGTGPFQLKSWEPNVKIILEARKDYWQKAPDGKPLPYLDGIESHIIPDYQARVAALRAGQFDEFYQPHNLLKADAEELKKQGMIITQQRDSFSKALLFNNSDPALSDVRLRRAISMGIDRKAFIDITLEGNGRFQDYTPIPGWEWDDATLQKNFARNVEEAKKLVSAAGKTGAKFVISTYKAGPAGQNEQATQLIMSNLKDIGLELTMESVPDFTTFNNTVIIPGKYQMMLLVAGDGVDPDTFLSGYLSDAPATLNRMRVKDTKLDGMIKEQRTLTDAGKRKSAIAAINQHIYDNMYVAPTAQVVLVSATQPWVQRNGAANHISGTLRPELIWLDKK